MSEINNDGFCEAASLNQKYHIIAASPIMPRDQHTLPHRIVIRDLGDELVVHMQVWEPDGHVFFCHGNYFKKSNDATSAAESDQEALKKAYTCFDRRARRTLHIGEESSEHPS